MSQQNWDISSASPPTLSHVIGNRRVVEQLRVTLESCFADHRPFPHTLFCGSQGTGKSLMCSIIAKEMGVPLVEILGQTLTDGSELRRTLLDLDAGSCLSIDEVHTLPDHCQVELFRAVEERKVFLPPTFHRLKPKTVKIPQFTLLAATTHESGILPPLLDRFRIICRLGALDVENMIELLRQRACALHWRVEEDVYRQVSARSRGVPRLALRLIESVYRTSRAEGSTNVTTAHAQKTFELEGLTGEIGLSPLEITYLRTLNEMSEEGLPARVNALAARLGVPVSTLMHVVEPPLLKEGAIVKLRDGRQITNKGVQLLSQ